MITITNTRYEGHVGGYSYDSTSHAVKPSRAFTSLIQYELGFGGRVVKIEPTCIIVETAVFSKVDLVEFRGPVEEMKILIMATMLFLEIRSRPETHEILVRRLMEITGGNPLLVTAGFGILTHGPIIRAVASMVTCRTQAEADTLGQIKDEKDFFAAVELCLEGHSALEVKELL